MKQFLLFALFSVASVQALALTADRFRCEFVVESQDSVVTSHHRQDFAVARLPFLITPSIPGVTVTHGTAPAVWDLKEDRGEFLLNMSFYYDHALRTINDKTDARQFTCLTVSGTYCAKGDKGCSEFSTMCAQSSNPDPFDPVHGWTETPVQEGIPMFNPMALAPIKVSVREMHGKQFGTATVTCNVMGTYW